MKDYIADKALLKNRIILVTGAGAGIGKAVSCALAEHGATVILLGRTEKKLDEVYDHIESHGWPTPAIVPFDLSSQNEDDYLNLADTLKNEFGRLDGILHNAAILDSLSPLDDYSLKQWSYIMQINLYAPYLLTRSCLGLLKQSDDASVVFTSADVGRQGRAYWGAYGIAAHAIEGMSQIWADELESNTHIRVNTIDPGAVATAMRTQAYPEEDKGNLTQPGQITSPYLYLLGPDSKKQTGKQFSAQ